MKGSASIILASVVAVLTMLWFMETTPYISINKQTYTYHLANWNGIANFSLVPNETNRWDLGNWTHRWRNLFLTGKLYCSGDCLSEVTVNSSQVTVPKLDGSDLDRLNEWISSTTSAGKISGGEFVDNGDGTLTVTAGTGLIRKTNSPTAEIYAFNWSDTTIFLVDGATNYVYVDYNSGSPIVTSATSLPSDHNTKVMLGLVYREGTTLHEVKAGQLISNFQTNIVFKDLEINGKFQRSTGLMISETGTRNFAITSGIIYAGLTKVSMPAFDSSGSDTFTYYYRDGSGGWTKVTGQTQIDNQHYDDGSGTLATLTGSGWFGNYHYGVHWVYEDIDGHVFVIYGRGDYTLAEAQASTPPNSVPGVISATGGLVGKIIIKKGDSSFTSVESPFNEKFVGTGVVNHNDLGAIQGGAPGEYYHLSQSAYDNLYQQNQEVLTTSDVVFNHINISDKNCDSVDTDSNGRLVCGTDAVDDADHDSTNELQSLQSVTDRGSTTDKRVTFSNGVQFSDKNQYLWYFSTATSWGLYWDTSANTFCYRGSGNNRFCVDGDNGNTNVYGSLSVSGSATVNGASGKGIKFGGYASITPRGGYDWVYVRDASDSTYRGVAAKRYYVGDSGTYIQGGVDGTLRVSDTNGMIANQMRISNDATYWHFWDNREWSYYASNYHFYHEYKAYFGRGGWVLGFPSGTYLSSGNYAQLTKSVYFTSTGTYRFSTSVFASRRSSTSGYWYVCILLDGSEYGCVDVGTSADWSNLEQSISVSSTGSHTIGVRLEAKKSVSSYSIEVLAQPFLIEKV